MLFQSLSALPSVCDIFTACSGGKSRHDEAVAEVSKLATLYESYVVRADVQLADLAPTARRQLKEVRSLNTPAVKAAARATALRIREITAERAKYEKLASKCNAEAKKLRDLHEFQATVSALGHLNKLLRRTDADALMRGAENAVADGEGATATIEGIGHLLGGEASGTAVPEVDEDELMMELEAIAGTAPIVGAPEVEVIGVPAPNAAVAPKPVSSTEYMRQLLGQAA